MPSSSKQPLLVLAATGVVVALVVFAFIAARYFGLWPLPAVAFALGFGCVLLAYVGASSAKLPVATGAYGLGVLVAWLVLEPAWLPESYATRGAYEPTHLPLFGACLGGFAGIVSALGLAALSRPSSGAV